LSGAVGGYAVGTLTGAEKFAGLGVETLPDGFELFRVGVWGAMEQ